MMLNVDCASVVDGFHVSREKFIGHLCNRNTNIDYINTMIVEIEGIFGIAARIPGYKERISWKLRLKCL